MLVNVRLWRCPIGDGKRVKVPYSIDRLCLWSVAPRRHRGRQSITPRYLLAMSEQNARLVKATAMEMRHCFTECGQGFLQQFGPRAVQHVETFKDMQARLASAQRHRAKRTKDKAVGPFQGSITEWQLSAELSPKAASPLFGPEPDNASTPRGATSHVAPRASGS